MIFYAIAAIWIALIALAWWEELEVAGKVSLGLALILMVVGPPMILFHWAVNGVAKPVFALTLLKRKGRRGV